MNFIKKHNTEIQSFSVVVLAIITGWYSVSTWRMANIMREEFNISNRPYIAIEKIEEEYKDNNMILDIFIKNRGKIPARIIKIETAGIPATPTDFEELILNPEEIRAVYDLTLFWSTGKEVKNIGFDMPIRIKYYSLGDKKERYEYCIEYLFTHEESGDITLNGAVSCEE